MASRLGLATGSALSSLGGRRSRRAGEPSISPSSSSSSASSPSSAPSCSSSSQTAALRGDHFSSPQLYSFALASGNQSTARINRSLAARSSAGVARSQHKFRLTNIHLLAHSNRQQPASHHPSAASNRICGAAADLPLLAAMRWEMRWDLVEVDEDEEDDFVIIIIGAAAGGAVAVVVVVVGARRCLWATNKPI